MPSRWLPLTAALLIAVPTAARAQSNPPQIPWDPCPCKGELGSVATVDVPDGFMFVGPVGVRTLLEVTQNPPSGKELGAVVSTTAGNSWFVIFSFEDSGYIRDDDKDQLDADAILATLQRGNERGNRERQRRGWPKLDLAGWQRPPFYDKATNNLTWATLVRFANGESVNHSVRLLGRRGVMHADLVARPDQLAGATRELDTLLVRFSFTSGNRYAEFTAGDKVANYGLTALIAGGAGAAAVKSGLLPKIWKLLVFAAVAAAGLLKRLFQRRSAVRAIEPEAGA